MEWIKFEDKLPEEGQDICVLIYENWSRDSSGKLHTYHRTPEEECWHVCGGSYSLYDDMWYIPCKPGIEGGVGRIWNDYIEGQLCYAVAWCPMPEIEEIR